MQQLPEHHRDTGAFVDELVRLVERTDERAARLDRTPFREQTVNDISATLGGTDCWLFTIENDAGCPAFDSKELENRIYATSPATTAVVDVEQCRHCICCEPVTNAIRLLLVVEVVDMSIDCAAVTEVLVPICRLFADSARQARLEHLEHQLSGQNALLAFMSRMSDHNNAASLCAQLATEGASLLDVDRVAVLTGRNGHFTLASITGAVKPHARSNSRRLLEGLANNATDASGLDAWKSLSDLDPADRAQALAADCMQDSASKQIRIHRPSPETAVILERYSQTEAAQGFDLTPVVTNHFARELQKTKRGPLKHLISTVFQSRWIILCLIAALMALVFVKVDFEIEAVGTLQPVEKRNVFAPEDGVIRDVFPVFDRQIDAKSPLLVLSNSQIELEREKLNGQLEAATSKLAALAARRAGTETERLSASAMKEELESQIKSLTEQVAIIQQQVETLRIVSPIAGRVFRRDLKDSLLERPVTKGQFLLQVADTEGAWELDLKIKDTLIRHVTQAGTNQLPKVRYVSLMTPDQDHFGQLRWISPVTVLEPNGSLSVRATVDVRMASLPGLDQVPESLHAFSVEDVRLVTPGSIRSWTSCELDFCFSFGNQYVPGHRCFIAAKRRTGD